MDKRAQIKRGVFEEEMIRRNLNGGQVAEMLGITHKYLSYILNGERYPSSKIREKILHLFYPVKWDDIFFIVDAHNSSYSTTSKLGVS